MELIDLREEVARACAAKVRCKMTHDEWMKAADAAIAIVVRQCAQVSHAAICELAFSGKESLAPADYSYASTTAIRALADREKG